MGQPFPAEIVDGGNNLLTPAIQSPNFSQANQTGWAILQSGLAYFFDITLSGGTITGPDYIFNTEGLFFYSGTPAAGNLVAWFAPAMGTDQFGNAFTQGLNVGGSSQNVALVAPPTAGQSITIGQSISGTIGAAANLGSGDASQVIAGVLAAVLLNTATSVKPTTVLGSPMAAGSGAYVLLEGENDAATDTAIITFGTTTTPDAGATIVYTPIMTIGPYYVLLYSGTSGTTVVTIKTAGSGHISTPAGAVSPGYGEAWGAGASTSGVSGGASALGGSGSGGYSAEPALVFTPGANALAYTVAASANGLGGQPADTTLAGSSATVTAHGGFAGTGSGDGAGAPASTNTIAKAGNRGGNPSFQDPGGGGGGGGAPGPSGAGSHGSGGSPTAGGSGGAGASGSGSGGQGGTPTGNGSPGSAPGGGGGGGSTNADGAIGGAGQVRFTYTTGTPIIMFSVASAAGTDQFGSAFSEGIHYTDPSDLNVYSIGTTRQTSTSTPTVSSTTPVSLGGISIPVTAGTYEYEAMVPFVETGANDAYVVLGFSGTGTIQGIVCYLGGWAAGSATTWAQTAFSNSGLNSPALAAGGRYCALLRGKFTVTAAGNVTISLAASANASTYTVITGSFLELKRV